MSATEWILVAVAATGWATSILLGCSVYRLRRTLDNLLGVLKERNPQ